jgi:DNA-binding transcriptional ArsR family regulator
MGDEQSDGGRGLAPDDAFAAIGHETRVEILEALATADRADRPLSFSELRERVGTVDSAKFNYHLGELVGHFVERSDEGYDFRRAGARVAEAILAGTVTDDAVIPPARIDEECHYCGAPVAVSYREERVETYCTECGGTYAKSNTQEDTEDVPDDYGFLGNLSLPPAGIRDRTPTEIHETAHTWSLSDRLLAASDTCPRCSATLDQGIEICENHEYGDGECDDCDGRYAVLHTASCTNCVFDQRAAFGLILLDETELQAFLTDHGINLVAPEYDRYASVVMDYEEELLGIDPFEARFTFGADADAIALTVDEEFDVVDVSRPGAADE